MKIRSSMTVTNHAKCDWCDNKAAFYVESVYQDYFACKDHKGTAVSSAHHDETAFG